MAQFLPVSMAVAGLWIILISLFFWTDLIPGSPYGLHNDQEPFFVQIASAPLFIYRSTFPVLSILGQLWTAFSPFQFERTTGEITRVVFSWPCFIEGVMSLTVLGTLEFLHRSSSPKMLKFSFGRTLILATFIIFMLRTSVGFISFHLGRQIMPSLYFSSSLREVSKGLIPCLISLYLILEACIQREDNYCFELTKDVIISLTDIILLVLIVWSGTSIWWNTAGIVCGVLMALYWRNRLVNDLLSRSDQPLQSDFLMPIRGLFKRAAFLFMTSLLLAWLKQPCSGKSSQLISLGDEDSPLAVFIIMTAPRKRDLLSDTIQSYLDALPSNPSDLLADRLKIVLFTHFTEHEGFDKSSETFGHQEKARHYFEWVRFPGNEFDQKKHLDAAIRHVAEKLYPKAYYIGILEDDFPLCYGSWPEVLRLIRDANHELPDHCGIFLGTGGSGLLIRRPNVEGALISMHGPHEADQGLHECLRGTTCPGCQVVIPSRILMRHAGNDASTLEHKYSLNAYQCGSRHMLVGDLDAVVL